MTKVVKADLLNIKEDYIRQAVEVLAAGGLVIIPTETVYGIAADMLNEKAIKRLYEIKKRPQDKLFSIAIDSKSRVEEFAREIPLGAYKLIDKFWPGPLTLILKGINQPSVGLRMPDNAIALKVIARLKDPLVLPSANLSGEPAPINFEAAFKALNGLVDFAIDSGRLRLGVESCVVDLRVEPIKILRPGALSQLDLDRVIQKKNILFVCTGNSCRSVMAEALFRKMLQDKKRDDVEVDSAGIAKLSGLAVSEAAKEILAREGIDVSGHLSQSVTKEILCRSDLILVMERLHEEAVLKIAPEVRNRVFLIKEFAKIDNHSVDIADPIGGSLDFYEQTFSTIKNALERVINLV